MISFEAITQTELHGQTIESVTKKPEGSVQSVKDEMVFIKGGCFDMGDTFGEGDGDERPVHSACVDDFYIGRYEVTQKQWITVMDNNPSSFINCDNCPVENVDYNDVQEFIRRLNRMTGLQYRLPTEAEWEYATRSGGNKEKWAGISSEDKLRDYSWYRSNSGGRTHTVGLKKANGLGLYDMSGNI
ncbi:MAG: SUMF1/EgtB/PvdO family nonheme iron enzyme, partial [Thermodesulfobacteriota bacterium]